MDRVDRSVSWLILGIGVLHCAVTFLLFHGFSESAMWFFSAGLAMMYGAALNLLRIEYAGVARGVLHVCRAANLSLLGFIVVYLAGRGAAAFKNPGAITLVVCVAAATAFSILRRPAASLA